MLQIIQNSMMQNEKLFSIEWQPFVQSTDANFKYLM